MTERVRELMKWWANKVIESEVLYNSNFGQGGFNLHETTEIETSSFAIREVS